MTGPLERKNAQQTKKLRIRKLKLSGQVGTTNILAGSTALSDPPLVKPLAQLC